MWKTETTALCVLFFFCSSSSMQGEHDSNSSARLQNSTMPPAPPPSSRSSTVQTKSLSSPQLLSASSSGDGRAAEGLSANDTLSQSYNETSNSTDAPGHLIESAEPTVTDFALIKATIAAGVLTESQEGFNLVNSNNQTSASSDTTLYTNATTSLPPASLTPSKAPQITTSPLETTTQNRGKYLTVTTRGTSAPTTINTTSSQTTELSSTSVLANTHVDTPSELNVGDNPKSYSRSTEIFLFCFMAVFFVIAAIYAILKFRHMNERPAFHRLQNLPMDDVLEGMPLSMYTY